MSLFDPYQINKRRVKKSHKGQVIQQRPSKDYFAISPSELPRSLQVIKSYLPSLLNHRKSVLITLQPTDSTSINQFYISFNGVWQLVKNQFRSELNFPTDLVKSFQLHITTLSIQFVSRWPSGLTDPIGYTLTLYSNDEENIQYTYSSQLQATRGVSIFPDSINRYYLSNNNIIGRYDYITEGNNSPNWINRSSYNDFFSVKTNQISNDYRYIQLTSDDLTLSLFQDICIVVEVSMEFQIK